MSKINALKRNGKIIWPASVSDAIIDRDVRKPISGLFNRYNLSTLWPGKYNLQTAIDEIKWRLRERLTPGTIIDFIGESGQLESWQLVNPVSDKVRHSLIDVAGTWKTSGGPIKEVENYKGRPGISYKGGLKYSSITQDLVISPQSDYYIEFDAAIIPGNYSDSISQVALLLSPTEPKEAKLSGEQAIFELDSKGLGSTIFTVKGTNSEVNLGTGWNHFKVHILSGSIEYTISSDQAGQLLSGRYDINFSSTLVKTIYFGLGKTSTDCYDYVGDIQAYEYTDNISGQSSPESCDTSHWVKLNLSEEVNELGNRFNQSKQELDSKIEEEKQARESQVGEVSGKVENTRETLLKKVDELEAKLGEGSQNQQVSIKALQDEVKNLREKILSVEVKEDHSISDTFTRLSDRINNLETDLNSSIAAGDSGLNDRVTSNAGQIENLKTRSEKFENNLTKERLERVNADRGLTINLENLTATVSSNKSSLDSAIDQEINNRVAADKELHERLDTTNSNLSREIERATRQEEELKSEIENKISNALASNEDIEGLFN